MTPHALVIQPHLETGFADVLTPAALDAIRVLAPFDDERSALMAARMQRRAHRHNHKERIGFMDPEAIIPRTQIRVQDARDGKFEGGEIPVRLKRQWIQGTGPGTRPRATTAQGIRNVAYALLSGADGWMFDGEDALGQLSTMSLENIRNITLAIHRDPVFMTAAKAVAGEMNTWAEGFFGHPIIEDYKAQLDFTTVIFRARGLHLDDRHIRRGDGEGFSASIVDAALFVVHNHARLLSQGQPVVLYLPKIQTAEEAALWNEILTALEQHLGMPAASIRTYVLVEQLEVSYQLMEVRAALGKRFVGYNTGRWDYINSVAEAMSWDPEFQNPNIDAIGMTYGYMRVYEDRVRRAVNTPDLNGRCALWQGGMEPNIPVGSPAGVEASMKKATAGGQREQQAGASGKWVAHWKMVHIVRPVWETVGQDNQLGRAFEPLSYGPQDAADLTMLEPAPRTIAGARDLLSVALQYGNAFGRGFQAAALKPADFFGNDDVLYLMEDAATGEIRVSILWEWLHKGAPFTEDDVPTGVKAGDPLTPELFERLLEQEYQKLQQASDKDVHDDSKPTTLPIAKQIVARYVTDPVKTPWYIDLLNLNLGLHDVPKARARIDKYLEALSRDGTRITKNLDFDGASSNENA